MIKVGVIVDNEYYADVRVRKEVSMLKSHGFHPFVLCLSFTDSYDYSEDGVEIITVRIHQKIKNMLYFLMNTFPFYEWFWSYHVSKFIRKNALSIVHTHDLYMSKAVKRGIGKSGVHIPMILDLHENYPHAILSYKWTHGYLRSALSRPKKWKSKERKYLSYADQIIILSEEFKNYLLRRYDFLKENKMLVLPNVVDTEQFDQFKIHEEVSIGLPPKPRLLYFGMVAERRGIFETLEVCSELIKEEEDFSLIIIGPVDSADKDRFFKEVRNSLFRDKISYIQWIDLKELPSYLSACDIALAPFEKNEQHESGIANKIFQYMYGKLPIIASNCKPQQDLIENHKIGEIFSTWEEFKVKLKKLLNDDELRGQMGERAFETLNKEFSHQKLSHLLKLFYNEALKN